MQVISVLPDPEMNQNMTGSFSFGPWVLCELEHCSLHRGLVGWSLQRNIVVNVGVLSLARGLVLVGVEKVHVNARVRYGQNMSSGDI